MTYIQLIDVLKNLKKKDAFILVNDYYPVQARLSFSCLAMTRYDNGKLVETKPDVRVSGNPIENLPELIYLTIVSTPLNHGRYSKPNTINIQPIATEWIKYLETLPSMYLQQELIFFSRNKNYGCNSKVAMKGGIGLNRIGIIFDKLGGIVNISPMRNEKEDEIYIKKYCENYKTIPIFWNEALIFDMTNESSYNDRSIYDPNNIEDIRREVYQDPNNNENREGVVPWWV